MWAPIIGLLFVFLGFACLLWLIPRSSSNTAVRTDVYSARASYWMVSIGLALVTISAIADIIVRSLAMLRTLGII